MRDRAEQSAILVPGHPDMPSAAQIERLAAEGKRPRKDYVELARTLPADVIDPAYLTEQASPAVRAVTKRLGILPGMATQAFLHRKRYRSIVAWADRIGLPLALIHKITRSRRDLVLSSVYLSGGKKAFFLKDLKVYSHLGAIVNFGSAQMEIAVNRLGVPREKLHLAKQPVDDHFWRPARTQAGQMICAVGWEARDYATLTEATAGMELQVQLAIGIAGFASSGAERSSRSGDGDADINADADADPGRLRYFESLKGTFSYPLYKGWMEKIEREGLPANVSLSHQLNPQELRALYARSRFVVLPLHEVEFDAGVTSLTEAMAMGKAVVLTRTKGQGDIIRDGIEGLYVPPGDARALRRAIEHLRDNPEKTEQMGHAGRALIEKEHRLDDYVRRIAEIVESVARPS